ncbi:hypothetical protein BASA81_010352 [Batrachochytrium salamandrivorans]|nr:hypothetical protein BASA81_010352 [Batrachochytrium salamandrivorans]
MQNGSPKLSERIHSQQFFSIWRTLLLCKTKDKLRLCMDYRGLNKQTIKDRNPIPLISEMLRTFLLAKYHYLDLRGAYNLLRIKRATNQDAFIRNTDNLNFFVMPFGLATLQRSFNE